MHGTVTPCVPGGARAVARMFATTKRNASTQYIVDPGEIVQAVRDDTIAYGAPPNKGAIHVEQCDMQEGPGITVAGRQPPGHAPPRRALVARLCLKYDVPIRKLNAADLKAGTPRDLRPLRRVRGVAPDHPRRPRHRLPVGPVPRPRPGSRQPQTVPARPSITGG
jgi:hypothetical protein